MQQQRPAPVLPQVLNVQLTPELETPQYSVLKAAADYELRRYDPYTVATVPMSPGSGETWAWCWPRSLGLCVPMTPGSGGCWRPTLLAHRPDQHACLLWRPDELAPLQWTSLMGPCPPALPMCCRPCRRQRLHGAGGLHLWRQQPEREDGDDHPGCASGGVQQRHSCTDTSDRQLHGPTAAAYNFSRATGGVLIALHRLVATTRQLTRSHDVTRSVRAHCRPAVFTRSTDANIRNGAGASSSMQVRACHVEIRTACIQSRGS